MKNRPCPICQAAGRDKTGDHLFLMKDGVTWACTKPYHPKYIEREGHQAEERPVFKLTTKGAQEAIKKLNEQMLKYVPTLSSVAIPDRGLIKATTELYGIKCEHSEETGEIVKHFYPQTTDGKITAYKERTLPKDFKVYGQAGEDLFGQSVFPAGGKRILIAGGELDAPSAYQMINKKYPGLKVACVSPQSGENMKSIIRNKKYVSSFKMIYVATDMDEVGQKLARQIVDLFGHDRVWLVELPEKDVNECLKNDKEAEFIKAFFEADHYKPSGIISVTDINPSAMEPTEWGLSYPWPTLTKLTYGLRTKSVIGIGAGPGAGKTTLVQQLQKHLIYEHKQRVAVFALEDTPEWTTKKIVGSIMNQPIHLPDTIYSIQKAQEVKETLHDYLYLFDHLQYHSWQDILDAIRYFQSIRVKWFFIDPLSALHAHMDASEANTFITSTMFDLEKMAKSMDVTFFHVNHLNNPQTGKDHGAGGKVYGGQFSGSRAQWKYSTDLWGAERNQLAEDEEEKNKVVLSIIKQRLSGETKRLELHYNKLTGNLTEDKQW